MEMRQESGAWNQEERDAALKRVQSFCGDWDKGNIISFISGGALVERLDEKGEQMGLYGFDHEGKLIDFTIGAGPSILNEMIDNLTEKGISAKIIEIEKKSGVQS